MPPSKTSSAFLLRPVAALLTLFSLMEPVSGHGRLMEPPGRSSMWRVGFNTPKNYNDMELFCGGFLNMIANGGRCGICGDPYEGPRENEAGGKYANGVIARHYNRGQTIEVKIDVTANHLGWFEFKICPNNDVHKAATQECLDRHVLRLADGSGTKLYIGSSTGTYEIKLVLPDDVTCSQCVFQWRWHTGHSNGFDENGKSCLGCGPQEEFYGCADIAIGEGSGSNPERIDTHLPQSNVNPPSAGGFVPNTVQPPNPNPPQPEIKPNFTPETPHVNPNFPSATRPSVNINLPAVTPRPAVHPQYPLVNPTSFIPGGQGVARRCFAVSPLWRNNPNYDIWCDANCKIGNCPSEICACI